MILKHPISKSPGIYLLTNIFNGKVYVGQTTSGFQKKDAQIFFNKNGGISNACNGRDNSFRGYKWRYLSKISQEELNNNKINDEILPNPSVKKKVVQIDKDTGKIVKIWDSIREACLTLSGKTKGRITNVCASRMGISYGCKWRYLTDISTEELDNQRVNC